MTDYTRVIILDDNETTIFLHQDLVGDLFSKAEIISFNNSDKFLEAALKSPEWFSSPSLLLLDINMPQRHGFEILEELDEEIEDLEHFHVLMVTSSNLKRDVERSTRFNNIKGYIEKPLDEEKILNILGRNS